MKYFLLLLTFFTVASVAIAAEDFYALSATDIDGNEYSFEQLKGKKVMIVNTASKCGFTPQYEQLQELHEQYGGENFVLLGFPSANFADQEYHDDEDIKDFCEQNFGVTFKLFSRIDVKGPNQHPVYQWLTQAAKNGTASHTVQWNFEKFLISENGELAKKVQYSTKPNVPSVIEWITAGVSVQKEIEMSIFPNPAVNYISFSRNADSVEIYNLIGNSVKEFGFVNANERIDVSDLPEGLYFIKVNGKVEKFIKM
jgi:glutathione peroxidase